MAGIKETVVGIYQRNGFDFMTACEYASDFLNDLINQKPGTTHKLFDKKEGKEYSFRNIGDAKNEDDR